MMGFKLSNRCNWCTPPRRGHILPFDDTRALHCVTCSYVTPSHCITCSNSCAHVILLLLAAALTCAYALPVSYDNPSLTGSSSRSLSLASNVNAKDVRFAQLIASTSRHHHEHRTRRVISRTRNPSTATMCTALTHFAAGILTPPSDDVKVACLAMAWTNKSDKNYVNAKCLKTAAQMALLGFNTHSPATWCKTNKATLLQAKNTWKTGLPAYVCTYA